MLARTADGRDTVEGLREVRNERACVDGEQAVRVARRRLVELVGLVVAERNREQT